MRRAFTDEEFMKYVTTLDSRRDQLRHTSQQWESSDLAVAAQRPLHYLPPEAAIR